MVTRGDGTQRLTLKLHPADLGEVHLTVTVKAGSVDVTLAAGHAAREALSDGSAQLRSLLELTGHAAGQLVIRDLPSAAPPPGQAAPAQNPQPGLAQGGGHTPSFDQQAGGGGQPGGQGAGRPGVPTSGPDPAAGAPPGPEPRTSQPAHRGGAAALDVRI